MFFNIYEKINNIFNNFQRYINNNYETTIDETEEEEEEDPVTEYINTQNKIKCIEIARKEVFLID